MGPDFSLKLTLEVAAETLSASLLSAKCASCLRYMEDFDYRTFIVQAFETRKRTNASYTMRAYAEDLGVSPQLLSQVLSGKLGLSTTSAAAIADSIALEGSRKNIFIAAVEAKHSRSQSAREAAQEVLKSALQESGFKAIALDHIAIASSWKHVAVCMLVDLDSFNPDPAWISTRVAITAEEASKVVNDLFKSGLLVLDETGKWRRQAAKTSFKLDESSPSLQNFYRQMWEKAEQSLENEDYGDRSFSSTQLSVSESDFEFIKSEIEAFRRGLISKVAARPGNAERIYSMGIQFFPLDRKRNFTS